MDIYELPHLGKIVINSLKERYEAKTDFNGQKTTLDLNFKGKSIERQSLDTVKKIINNLADYNSAALTVIRDDYNTGDSIYDEDGSRFTVKDYIEDYLGNFDGDSEDNNPAIQEAVLSKLQLIRVGFYPENENQFAVFEYTLAVELIDYLIEVFDYTLDEEQEQELILFVIVVNFKENGEVDSFTVEN
ncbi:MAG: DUF2004 domain-containing protein [Daejeonella sp.]